MGCFTSCTGENWWIIILLLFILACDDDCGFINNIRNLVCGDNLIWIIALLLLCNSCDTTTDRGLLGARGRDCCCN